VVTVLVHDNLQCIDFYDFGDFILYFMIFICKFKDFLNDPASIAMQTDKKKLFFGYLVNNLFLSLGAHLKVFLDDVITEFIVDEGMEMGIKILKDLVF